jgi:hypothetical protein
MNYNSRINQLASENRYNEADKLTNIYLKRVIAHFIDILSFVTLTSGFLFLITAIWSYL